MSKHHLLVSTLPLPSSLERNYFFRSTHYFLSRRSRISSKKSSRITKSMTMYRHRNKVIWRYCSPPSSFLSSREYVTASTLSAGAEGATATTIRGLWKESTHRFLDGDRAPPVGSMDSLQWQLAETLILYWSSFSFEDDVLAANISMRLIDRLAEERAATALLEGGGDQGEASDSDFDRTVDISLIHAVLMQWKGNLQYLDSNSNYYQSRRRRQRCREEKRNNIIKTDGGSPTSSLSSSSISTTATEETTIIRPSEMLGKIDAWAFASSLFVPNIATYTIIMDGAAVYSHDDFPPNERISFAENLLRMLIVESKDNRELRPTIVTVGAFLNVLATCKTIDGAKKAELWLRRLQGRRPQQQQEQQQSRNCSYSAEESYIENQLTAMRPNTIIYTTVIRAWANVGRADKAEALLREMYEGYVLRNGGNESDDESKPTTRTFNTVLSAWSRSNDPESVARAEAVLRTMMKFKKGNGNMKENYRYSASVAPTIVSYNCLMSTIARQCKKEPDSLGKAEYWMEKMLENVAAEGTAVTATGRNLSPAKLRQSRQKDLHHEQQKHVHHQPRRSNEDGDCDDDFPPASETTVVMPNSITYKALFNVIATSSDISNKADRARYWLARSGCPKLMNNSSLLYQIDKMAMVEGK